MTWPEVISKLAEVGLDEHAPKLKELGYDSMDAFDADDKAALEKIADELELKSGHKAKFVKKFSTKENEEYPKMEPAQQQAAVAAPQNIVVNVSGGGGTDNETKVPATWLAGEWNGDGVDHTCCCTSTLEIAAVGADAFDLKLGDRSATVCRRACPPQCALMLPLCPLVGCPLTRSALSSAVHPHGAHQQLFPSRRGCDG